MACQWHYKDLISYRRDCPLLDRMVYVTRCYKGYMGTCAHFPYYYYYYYY